MEHLWGKHNISVSVSVRKVCLNNVLYVAHVHQPLHIFGNEHLGFGDFYHLLHPAIELSPSFLGGQIVRALRAIVRAHGVKAFAFTRHAEVLTRETTYYHVHLFGEYLRSCFVLLYQVHHAFRTEDGGVVAIAPHETSPRQRSLFQNVVGEHQRKVSGLHTYPILVYPPFYPFRARRHALVGRNKTALEPQVHTTAPGKE